MGSLSEHHETRVSVSPTATYRIFVIARMQSDIALVHVHRERIVDEMPAFGLTGSDARDAAENYVLASAERLREGSVRRVTGTVLDGSTHGRGASRLLLGSVADKVIRGTACSMPILRRR